MRRVLLLGLTIALLPSLLRPQAPPSRTDALLTLGILQVSYRGICRAAQAPVVLTRE